MPTSGCGYPRFQRCPSTAFRSETAVLSHRRRTLRRVRIELSVEGPAGSRDVAIETPPSATWALVEQAVRAAVDAPPGAVLSTSAGPVQPDDRLCGPRLRVGARLRLGTVAPAQPAQADPTRILQVSGGRGAGTTVAVRSGQVVIGRGPECDLRLDDDAVSRRHAALHVGRTGVTLHDLGSTNGTLLDGTPVGRAGVAVHGGQQIRVGDSLLAISERVERPAAIAVYGEKVLVNRSPRLPLPAAPTVVEVPARPQPTPPRPVQWLAALLPAVAGGALAWITGSLQFLLFILLTPAMLLSSALGERVRTRRANRTAHVEYLDARRAAARTVDAALTKEATARREAAPDPATIARIAAGPGRRIWERGSADDDQLRVRVATGKVAATLRTRTGATATSAGLLTDVPVCVDLRAGPLGIVGPLETARAVCRWALLQLAVLVSPEQLDVALFLSSDAPAWHWARWLPHLRGHVACTAAEWGELAAELAAERAVEVTTPPDFAKRPGRRLVLVLDRAGEVSAAPGLAALLSAGPSSAVTALCVDNDRARLPASCTTIARISGDAGTWITLAGPAATAESGGAGVADQVSCAWAERVARHLAPLVDGAADTRLPVSCGLLDALDLPHLTVDAVRARWACSDGSASTALGVGDDGPLRLDLAVDGPHALVGGTTGSGKSALLRSLVTGLALSHPPSEIAFALIDYKGGAAFLGCDAFPHTVGLVTDLDPHLTRRALRSLDAEIRRRERLFAAAGAPDFGSYRAASPAEPVPRLVIVVDEFATLTDELPEFVRGLVGVAQRGRSLGLHLVLATQRPATAISAEIKANTSLRIALRVTDPAESADIIDSPAAATIRRDTPGRAVVRVGTELVAFQTAQVDLPRGVSAAGEVRVEVLDRWRRRTIDPAEPTIADEGRSGTAVAEVLAAAAAGCTPPRAPWLDPLPADLPATAPAASRPGSLPHEIVVGVVDLPDQQAQAPLVVDLCRPGGLLLCGAARTGRTTALATLTRCAAERLDPASLEIYAIDPSGALTEALRALPHVATALGPSALEVVPMLLNRLAAGGTGRPAAPTRSAVAPTPVRLLVADDFDRMMAAGHVGVPGEVSELLLELLRVAPERLTCVVSGGRSLLAPRFASSFASRLLLRLDDRADYLLAGVAARDVPDQMPPGRGLRAVDAAEFQLLASPGPSSLGAAPESAGGGRLAETAVVLRPLPAVVERAGLRSPARGLLLGVGGDAAVPVAVDPFAGAARMLVAGPPRSGRSTALGALLAEALRVRHAVVVAAPARSPLSAAGQHFGVPVLDPAGGPAGSGPPPPGTLLLVDDSEAFLDTALGDDLTGWLRAAGTELAAVVSARADELATAYRGLGVEIRRNRSGLLLQPGPLEGELLGIRLDRSRSVPARSAPPGRGVLVDVATPGLVPPDGEPVPVQVARAPAARLRPPAPCAGSDDRSPERWSP